MTTYTYDDSGLSAGEWTTSIDSVGGCSILADKNHNVAENLWEQDARAICQVKKAYRALWDSLIGKNCTALISKPHGEDREIGFFRVTDCGEWYQDYETTSQRLQILRDAGVVKAAK